jgi:hypothetical protein
MTGRAHDVKHEEMQLRRSLIYFRAAESPMDLASVPARFVVADES